MSKNEKKSPKIVSKNNNILTIIKQAFQINAKPFPWSKAIGTGICSAFPVIIGLLTNHMQLGLLGVVGSFSYLYVFNEPYAIRAKKILFVAIGISLSVALGSLLAEYHFLVIIVVALIGMIATFIFGILKISGPAAVFFVLSFIMTTGMPVEHSAVFERSMVVLTSGVFSWLVSLVGWIVKPHEPEIRAVRNVYLALEKYGELINQNNTNNINNMRQQVVNLLNESEEIISIAYLPWKNSYFFNRLVLLNEQANRLFLEMLELHTNKNVKIPDLIIEEIKKLTIGIDLKDGEKINISKIPEELREDYYKLIQTIYDIEAIINLPLTYIGRSVKISKTSFTTKVLACLNKDSVVFVNSIKYGIILAVATIIAFMFPFVRPYWVTLSCATVMLGATIQSTFHRAIQRSCGTILGLIVGMIIFKFNPEGIALIVTIMCLTGFTELFIVKNYALAVAFITPNALLIAENSTQIHNFVYFGTARIIDIVLGALIALIGTYILGRRSASSRLSNLIKKLIDNESKVLSLISNMNVREFNKELKNEKEKMQINLMNLKVGYNTALGEIPSNKEKLETMWPVIFSLEHICYLIDNLCISELDLSLSKDTIKNILDILNDVKAVIDGKQKAVLHKINELGEISQICKEINMLQEALILIKE